MNSYSTTYVVGLHAEDIITDRGPEAISMRIGDAVTVVCDTAPGQTKRTAEQAAAMRMLAEHALRVAGELESRIAAGEGAAA